MLAEVEKIPLDWPDPVFDAAAAAKQLALPDTRLWVAGAEDTKGVLLARLLPEAAAEILTLFMRPEARRRGLARALVQALMDAARQARCAEVFLDVRVSNAAARALYESFGFTEISRRAGYYKNPVEDAVVLRREVG